MASVAWTGLGQQTKTKITRSRQAKQQIQLLFSDAYNGGSVFKQNPCNIMCTVASCNSSRGKKYYLDQNVSPHSSSFHWTLLVST